MSETFNIMSIFSVQQDDLDLLNGEIDCKSAQ